MLPQRVTQRILVVDDDREIARLMWAYLEPAGFQVLINPREVVAHVDLCRAGVGAAGS
jgi:DNA-binding response OmpR family regulator